MAHPDLTLRKRRVESDSRRDRGTWQSTRRDSDSGRTEPGHSRGTAGLPQAQRARIALEETGVRYETALVPKNKFESQSFLDVYASVLPGAPSKVPVLEIDGIALTESLVVVEYLAERAGANHPFNPPNARARALARLMVPRPASPKGRGDAAERPRAFPSRR